VVVVAKAIPNMAGIALWSTGRIEGPLPLKRAAICCVEQVRIKFGSVEACLAAALFRALYHPDNPRHPCSISRRRLCEDPTTCEEVQRQAKY
jgi:hypothetical protein